MITIIGQFFGSSGYAKHTRYLTNELGKLTKCALQTNIPQGFEKDVNDLELQMLKEEPDNEINLIITHPMYWRVNCNAKRNIVYLIWEGDSVPEYMLDECLNPNIEKIIVPSTHTYNALLKTYWKDKPFDSANKEDNKFLNRVHIIPHGVDLDTFYPQQPEVIACQGGGEGTKSGSRILGQSESGTADDYPPVETFKFLANKGLTSKEDRGGIQYLIEAYITEFKPEENVELILKVNPAYGVPNLLKMFPELTEKTPKITFITEEYTNKQMNDLYNKCDVFVSPTRSEAFNLPCLEAMACGKPVITTDFGGQTDYVQDSFNGILIGGKLTEVEHDIQYEGIKWLTPNIEQLRVQLRGIFTQNVFNEKVCVDTAKRYTWKNTAQKIHCLITNNFIK